MFAMSTMANGIVKLSTYQLKILLMEDQYILVIICNILLRFIENWHYSDVFFDLEDPIFDLEDPW